MNLLKNVLLLSALAASPAQSADNPQRQPTQDQLEKMSSEDLANSDLNLRLGSQYWEALFPEDPYSENVTGYKQKVLAASKIRTEKRRVDPQTAQRSIDEARQLEQNAKRNVSQGFDAANESEIVTQDLNTSITSILKTLVKFKDLAQQSGDAFDTLKGQVDALKDLYRQSQEIDQSKKDLLTQLDGMLQQLKTEDTDKSRVIHDLNELLALIRR